ncbi:MAG TPA: SH3 domain-containing protein [Leptolyngbyaceae cyanobacterium M33_DOE_097]|uniref:SH3 domain-containing protein n=1 Tax=Oscillatoriales cyanobacterium SpSt-418 TaxID=2282169 RepID=A0A7C3KFP4_9CYAN|nr:SH3 domain-containing protein [Leptolyngbyaceae cyanobacterium M33_DOE_097]
MHIRKIAAACLAGCAGAIFSISAALAQLYTVTSNDLNVRRGPGTNFPITYVLKKGDRVEVTRRQGDWAFIVGERGGEGWVFARYLKAEKPTPPTGGTNTNEIFKSTGTINNARYSGRGDAQMVIVRPSNNQASMSLTAGGFSIEYIGVVRSNFEGTIQLQVNQFRSSEMGYRTVPASGNCDIQASAGVIRRSFCTVTGSGIDHGRSNFTAR